MGVSVLPGGSGHPGGPFELVLTSATPRPSLCPFEALCCSGSDLVPVAMPLLLPDVVE